MYLKGMNQDKPFTAKTPRQGDVETGSRGDTGTGRRGDTGKGDGETREWGHKEMRRHGDDTGTPRHGMWRKQRNQELPIFFCIACLLVPASVELATHERIVLDPKAPGFGDPLLRVINTDSWPGYDSRTSDVLARFEPNVISQQIRAVKPAINPHRYAEFAWPVGEVVIGLTIPALTHQFDSFDRFDRANQHCVRDFSSIRDDVELVVHAVDEKDICRSSNPVHWLGALSTSPTIGMCCAIERAAVGFGFDNDSGNTFATSSGHNEQLTEQIAGDGYDVWAGVKRSWEFCFVHQLSLPGNPRVDAKGAEVPRRKESNKAKAPRFK